MNGAYDAVVVGGGVVGSATAHALAPDHDVLVLEAGSRGGETSPKASGLTSVVPDLPGRPEAARYAVEFFEAFDGTGEFEHTDRPGVHLVTSSEEGWAREHAAEKREQGFDVTYLGADELGERYPDAFDLAGFVGGIEFADCGWVDPYTYTVALAEAAERDGAEYEAGVEVESVRVEGGAVGGVETTEGTVDADHVVCAAGWRTRELLAEHVEVPLRPFRWQTVNLEVDRDLTGMPMGWDDGSRTYWRPEHNGDLHVGGGTYYVDDPGDVAEATTEAFRRHVAETIVERVRDVEDARVASGDTCPTGDADTPDGEPIIDAPAGAPDGLVVAVTGPVGGIMCSPFVARAVRELVADDPAPFPTDGFRLDRFDDRSTGFQSEHVTYWSL